MNKVPPASRLMYHTIVFPKAIPRKSHPFTISQHMTNLYQRNIYCLYVIKLSKWLMLIMPVVTLFYTANDLDHFDIFLLQAIYSISVAVMEIPSGYMADIIGRKKTLILGSILGSIGYMIYAASANFSGFLCAEIILGLGGSFISGADSAMLFDSLAALRNKHRYLQYEGRITSLGNFAETAAAVCGGLIAAMLSYRAVYVAQALVAAIAIPASFLLIEPAREALLERPGLRHILAVCKQALFLDKILSSTILVSAVTGIATLSMAWSAQIYFVNNGFTEVVITPLWICLNLTVATVAAFATQVRHFLGNRLSLLLILFFIPLSYVLLGLLPLYPALCILLLFYGVRGYATPVLKDLINQNCASATRATVLSIRSLIIRFGFACLGPFIGVVSGKTSLSLAFILAGTLLTIFSALAGLRLFISLPSSFDNDDRP